MTDFEYQNVSVIAEDVVRKTCEAWSSARAEHAANPDATLRHVVEMLVRRDFGALRQAMRCRNNLERFVLECFITSRIRKYVRAYLSVQEGSDFEGAESYDTPIPDLIEDFLQGASRKPIIRIRRGGWLRPDIRFDPIQSLRRVYYLTLRQARGKRLTLWQRLELRRSRSGYRRQLWLLSAAGRTFLAILCHKTPDPVARLFRLETFELLLRAQLPMVFAEATRFSEEEWKRLVAQIRDYFPTRINVLLSVIPKYSLESNGLIKLFKVAVGVVAGRISSRSAFPGDGVAFVYDTLRAAYCWGLTYPLVDNVLDSAELSPKARRCMSEAILKLFSDEPTTCDELIHRDELQGSPEVVEVLHRLAETLELVPPGRLARVKAALTQLYASHQRDSARRLGEFDENDPNVAREVLVDTALKSALVRLGTMEICGISTDAAMVRESLERGIFNQLGDDLWDIYEDLADRRVTPFTLFLTTGRKEIDPFSIYLYLTRLLSRQSTRVRSMAAYLGFCETLRDFLDSLERHGADALGAQAEIARVLKEEGGIDSREFALQAVPHVDFDALLFLGEASAFDLVPREN